MTVVKRVLHWTVDDFIRVGTEIHNGKYNYNLIDPNSTIRSFTKVPIKCKTCDHIFNQSVRGHVNGKQGCPACNKKPIWTPVRFIEKATEIHGDKYDYSLIDMNSKIRVKTKVPIKCKKCTYIFEQQVAGHITKKCGCPDCAAQRWTPIEFIRYATYIKIDMIIV